ncbi:MAG: T9SS type A sorting domain-containing protein [Saprospiraceae bacterium]|nr:T9SS type A sorting domain-containing protein [Saprospiraceae bacterium]
MRYNYFFLIFSWLIINPNELCSQEIINLTPSLERSFGSREHTSRDELLHVVQDSSGNLLLSGFVEGDSFFADVSIQKITPDGTLLWDYRLDSHNKNDYDYPIRMCTDAIGNCYVLGLSTGLSTFFDPQFSNGFLFKLSTDGQLIWRVDFDTLSLFPHHDSGLQCNGYLNSSGNFIVSYTTYRQAGNDPTYFVTFSPSGNILQHKIKYNLNQVYGLDGQAIDSTGNFIFIKFDDNSYPKHYLRKINPNSGAESINQFSLDNLSTVDSSKYLYLNLVDIWIDEYNNVYTGNNLTTGGLSPTFFVGKIESNGEMKYIFHPKDSTQPQMNTIIPWRGYAYITGSYIPKNHQKRAAFIWKINEIGQIEKEIHVKSQENHTPRFLKFINNQAYWVVEDIESNKFKFICLDGINLSAEWSYDLHVDPSYIFTGTEVIINTAGEFSIAGTMSKEKQQGSSYLSDNEYYIETFAPASNTLVSQYVFSEKGTTHIESDGFSVDPFGNYYIRSTEVVGPEYFLIQYSPRNYYYYKYSKDGDLLWSTLSPHQAYYHYSIEPFYFDYVGNAYTTAYGIEGDYLLLKINEVGQIVDSLKTPYFLKLLIDKQNRLHLTSAFPSDGTYDIKVYDNNFQLIKQGPIGYIPVEMFQLPFSDDVYYYVQNAADWNETSCSMALFKENNLIWEKTFNFNDPIYQRFNNESDVNPNTGELLVSSLWRGVTNEYEFLIHTFPLNGEHNAKKVQTTDNQFPKFEGRTDDGNIYLNYDNKIELYDPNLNLLSSTTVGTTPSGGYFFDRNNHIFRATDDSVSVYSNNLQTVTRLVHHSFTTDPAKISFTPSGKLATCETFGDNLGGGYAYGWRWIRGNLQDFDLSGILTSGSSESYWTTQAKTWPNPATEEVYVESIHLQEKDIRINLVDQLGRNYNNLNSLFINDHLLRVDLTNIPAGAYWINITSANQTISSGVIVVPK